MFGMRKNKRGDNAAEQTETPSARCKACGSSNTRRVEFRSLGGGTILGGAVRVMRVTVCRDCGKKDVMLYV